MVRSPAILQSVTFHVALVVAFAVGMPYLSRDIAPEQPVLTVDIVNTLPETNLEEGAEGKAKPASKPAEEDKVEEQEAPPPPPKPAPAPAPKPVPQIDQTAEAVPTEKPVAAPEKPPEKPKAKPKAPKPISAPPKRPVQKSPEFKKRQQEQAQLTSKLQDLTERKAEERRKKEEKEKKKKEAKDKLKNLLKPKDKKKNDTAEREETEEKMNDIIGQALNTKPKTSGPLGVSVTDRLRNHLAVCWSPPPGASGADALIVDIIVRLNNRAEVQSVDIVDKARFSGDGTFKAAAQAAVRAVRLCSPLPLPLDKYDTWKELQFEFNPAFITRS